MPLPITCRNCTEAVLAARQAEACMCRMRAVEGIAVGRWVWDGHSSAVERQHQLAMRLIIVHAVGMMRNESDTAQVTYESKLLMVRSLSLATSGEVKETRV